MKALPAAGPTLAVERPPAEVPGGASLSSYLLAPLPLPPAPLALLPPRLLCSVPAWLPHSNLQHCYSVSVI